MLFYSPFSALIFASPLSLVRLVYTASQLVSPFPHNSSLSLSPLATFVFRACANVCVGWFVHRPVAPVVAIGRVLATAFPFPDVLSLSLPHVLFYVRRTQSLLAEGLVYSLELRFGITAIVIVVHSLPLPSPSLSFFFPIDRFGPCCLFF